MHYGKPSGIPIRLLAGLLALAAVQIATAQTIGNDRVSAAEFGRLWGNAMGNGTQTQVRNFPGSYATGSGANNVALSSGPGGVTVSKGANFPLAAGRSAPIDVVARVKPASLGKAVGNLAKNLATRIGPAAVAAGVGVTLYDFAKDLGFTVDNEGGSVTVTKEAAPDANGSYNATGIITPPAGAIAACNSAYSVWGDVPACAVMIDPVPNAGGTHCGRSNGYCVLVRATNNLAVGAAGPGRFVHQQLYGIAPGGLNLPAAGSSLQALEDAIAAKSGWPSGNNTKVVEVLREAMRAGQVPETEQVSVSGPSSVPGPSSTTNTPAQNGQPATTTTKTTTYNITYAGDTITTNVTNTTVVNNGDTVTTTTETTEVAPQEDACKADPSTIGCSEFGTPQDGDPLPSETVAVVLTPVAFTSNATCPEPYGVTLSAAGYEVSPQFEFSGLCNAATNYVRPIVVVLGLALAGFVFVGGLKT